MLSLPLIQTAPRSVLTIALLGLAMLMIGLPAAAKADDDYRVCGGQELQPWQGDSVGGPITIPSQTHPNGIDSYAGSIFRPADLSAYPGPRPVVLLQHGKGGNQCALYWAARLLAGHGYVAMIWRSDPDPNSAQALVNGLDAMRSAIAATPTDSNPFRSITDDDRIGLAGHSMGSIVASVVQGDGNPGVRAAIASDNLHRWIVGDPGAASQTCDGLPGGEVTPLVPALGFAKDEPCNARPDVDPPDLKQHGFHHWTAAGLPSMELVMRGFEHNDFAGRGSAEQHRYLAHYYLAWFGLWLEGDDSQRNALLADTVEGVTTSSILSERFRSAAYLPGADPPVATGDFASWLDSDRIRPRLRKLTGSSHGKIPRRHVRRHGLRFRFRADEKVDFECRFDDRRWRPCTSPQRRSRATVGHHRFRVRARDLAGNPATGVLRWRLRVTRGR